MSLNEIDKMTDVMAKLQQIANAPRNSVAYEIDSTIASLAKKIKVMVEALPAEFLRFSNSG